ncbi:MAG: hypothetical protein ABEH43_02035, partial [Flavobacteriales bacterium]
MNCSPSDHIPSNDWGYQYPKSGKGFGGFAAFLDTTSSFAPYREYMTYTFKKEIESNKKYCISSYFSLSEKSKYSVEGVGFYFSKDSITTPNFFKGVIKRIPNIKIESNLDTTNWYFFSKKFNPSKQNLRFMTIGNFSLDSNTVFYDSATSPPWYYGTTDSSGFAYYYIDDVSVI